MGMIGNLRLVSDAEIERLLINPSSIARFLYGTEVGPDERLAIDRAWHAIHFVLTGTRLGGAGPLDFLVSEGTPVGEVDVGYGPARVLSSRQVGEVAAALATLEPGEVAQRVDLAMLDQHAIYPGRWQQNGMSIDYVVSHYSAMRDLIQRAARNSLGLVLYIN